MICVVWIQVVHFCISLSDELSNVLLETRFCLCLDQNKEKKLNLSVSRIDGIPHMFGV